MSGETEQDISGWTTDTLKAFVLALMQERNERLEDRFTAQEKAITDAFRAHEKLTDAQFTSAKEAVNAALVAQERAVSKAEVATEKRFEGVNEFRAQLADQARDFMPRKEYEVQHQPLVERIAAIEHLVERESGQSKGREQFAGYIIGAVGVIGGIIAIIAALVATR